MEARSSSNEKVLDVDLLVRSAAAASRIATAITEDLGADPGQVFILRETPNRYHVVASGPFRGASSSDVAGLLAYLEPRSFNATSHAGTRHQEAYQEYTAKRLQDLASTPSVALHEALARHPATRHDPHGAVVLLKQDLAPKRLDEHPDLRRLVHEQALQHVFPEFDSKRSRGDPLESLLHHGRALLEQAGQLPARGAQKGRVHVGTSLAAHVAGIPGLKSRRTRFVLDAVARSSAAGQEARLEDAFQEWNQRVRRFLSGLSVARLNLALQGNSSQQVASYARAVDGARVATRLGRAVRFLERLDGQPLVFNGEIPDLLKRRQEERHRDRKLKAELRLMDIPEIAPGFDALKFPNRAALHARLEAYPDERQMMEGAMDVYLGDSRDRHRQALSSARTALESLAKRITGSDQWREAIGNVAGKSTKNVFRETFHYLSAKGVHGNKAPTKQETEFGIQQALACVFWLVSHEHAFRDVPVAR